MASGDHQNTSPSSGEESASQSSPLKKPAAKKGKAGSSKKMTQKEQSERFIETARGLDVAEGEVIFDAFFDSLATKKGST